MLAEQNLRTLLLADHQWVLAEKLVEALGELEVATTSLGGEKYCTMSLVAPVIHGLLEKMDELSSSLHQRHPSASSSMLVIRVKKEVFRRLIIITIAASLLFGAGSPFPRPVLFV